jgi:hypothetical protein
MIVYAQAVPPILDGVDSAWIDLSMTSCDAGEVWMVIKVWPNQIRVNFLPPKFAMASMAV